MTSEELIFAQYKLYTEQKEQFVVRSFQTNKFYLVLNLLIILAMFLTQDYTFCWGISSTFVFSIAGMAICTLWWINMDSYNMLTKVKYSRVIEELEKKLPVAPYTDEFVAIKDYRKNKKMFMFSDTQKCLSTLTLILFVILFINAAVPMVMQTFFS